MTSEVFNPLSRKPSPKTDSQELAKKGEWTKLVLIGIVVVYLALVLFIPALNVFVQAFDGGIEGFINTFRQREFVNALRLTLLMAAIASHLTPSSASVQPWRWPANASLDAPC